jgi:hypothetical protein
VESQLAFWRLGWETILQWVSEVAATAQLAFLRPWYGTVTQRRARGAAATAQLAFQRLGWGTMSPRREWGVETQLAFWRLGRETTILR